MYILNRGLRKVLYLQGLRCVHCILGLRTVQLKFNCIQGLREVHCLLGGTLYTGAKEGTYIKRAKLWKAYFI